MAQFWTCCFFALFMFLEDGATASESFEGAGASPSNLTELELELLKSCDNYWSQSIIKKTTKSQLKSSFSLFFFLFSLCNSSTTIFYVEC